jgi:hypothetical protein
MSIIVVTPGNGVFSVHEDLVRLTKVRWRRGTYLHAPYTP